MSALRLEEALQEIFRFRFPRTRERIGSARRPGLRAPWRLRLPRPAT